MGLGTGSWSKAVDMVFSDLDDENNSRDFCQDDSDTSLDLEEPFCHAFSRIQLRYSSFYYNPDDNIPGNDLSEALEQFRLIART